MKHLSLNVLYCSHRDDYLSSEDDKNPFVCALQNVMGACEIYRLFDKKDVYELIYRATIVFNENPVIGSYLEDDTIFHFNYKENIWRFTVKELSELVGFEHINTIKNHLERDEWLERRGVAWKNAMLTSVFMGCNTSLLKPEEEQSVNETGDIENVHVIKSKPDELTPISDEIIRQAKFLAEDILNKMGDEPFNSLKENHAVKFKELEMRRNAKDAPEFDFEKLPIKKQEELWKHWWPKLEHFNDPDEREWVANLCRLAFYFANGFIEDMYGNTSGDMFGLGYPDERVDIDYDLYELREGGFNLVDTMYEEDLQAIFPLLFDEEASAIAQRPWEKLMQEAYG